MFKAMRQQQAATNTMNPSQSHQQPGSQQPGTQQFNQAVSNQDFNSLLLNIKEKHDIDLHRCECNSLWAGLIIWLQFHS